MVWLFIIGSILALLRVFLSIVSTFPPFWSAAIGALGMSSVPTVDPLPPTIPVGGNPQASRSDVWSGVGGTLLGAVIGFAAAW
jgi:hypothetical protein